jgi:hypothetical protein
LCGDPRIFDELTKVPQVFRNPGGSPTPQSPRDRYLRGIQSVTLVRGYLDRQGAKSVVSGIGSCLPGRPFNNFLADL